MDNIFTEYNLDTIKYYTDNYEYCSYDIINDNIMNLVYSLIPSKDNKDYDKLMNLINLKNHSIISCIALASAITAYSRMIVDPFKRIPNNECYYSDTDSVFLEKPQDISHLSNDLGNMKNEIPPNGSKLDEDSNYYVTDAVFVAPKMYGYKTHDGITKSVVKGVSRDSISLEDQNKFIDHDNYIYPTNSIKRLSRTIISIKEVDFTANISGIFNKRDKIFKDNRWVDTKPISLSYVLHRRYSTNRSIDFTQNVSIKNIDYLDILNKGYYYNSQDKIIYIKDIIPIQVLIRAIYEDDHGFISYRSLTRISVIKSVVNFNEDLNSLFEVSLKFNHSAIDSSKSVTYIQVIIGCNETIIDNIVF